MNQIGRIPVTDEQAERMVSPDTLADLVSQIIATPPGSPVIRRRRGRVPRRGMLLGASLAAAAAAAAVALVLVGSASPAAKPLPAAAARALAFTVKDGYITVIVKNPYADPAWYNADFKKYHLNVTLRMRPVSPSLVGQVIFTDESPSGAGKQITTITAKGCQADGGSGCPVGIRVPLNFSGQYDVYFGRAARPDEQYTTVGSAFAPAEALHGMKYIIGQPLSTVLTELGSRHLTAVLHLPRASGLESPGQSPGPWYVWGATPYAPGKAMLWLGHSKPTSSNPDPNNAS